MNKSHSHVEDPPVMCMHCKKEIPIADLCIYSGDGFYTCLSCLITVVYPDEQVTPSTV